MEKVKITREQADALRKVYDYPPAGSNQHSYAAGIANALDLLNIKIEGIN